MIIILAIAFALLIAAWIIHRLARNYKPDSEFQRYLDEFKRGGLDPRD